VLRLVTTSRRALMLYGALLVLPTLVLGVLYWSELHRDFARERESIPQKANDAKRRIRDGMADRLLLLLDAEGQRSFTQYADAYWPESMEGEFVLQRTPLEMATMPAGILGWFAYERERAARDEQPPRIYVGEGTPDREALRRSLQEIVQGFRHKDFDKPLLERVVVGQDREVPICALAVSQSEPEERECVRTCMPGLRGKSITVNLSDFRLYFYKDADRRPVAIASRRVKDKYSPRELPEDAPCLAHLAAGFTLDQGFVIDLQWLLKDLPWDIAKTALDDDDEELRVPPEALPMQSATISQLFADFLPIEELGFETEHPEDKKYGRLEIVIDTVTIEERIARQSESFLMTGGMLLVTLAIGMTLLYTSVRRELDQAHRMQNFVAAVTHELRTPISTIRLHAEMLQDGWVGADKQPEYYGRIVRETQRLSMLVERVLEKSRLKENVTRPVPGDLNAAIEAQKEDLLAAAGDHPDVDFQLEPGLPKVWLTQEAISMIVSNLVENARKYAPAGKEPLRVRTRWSDGRVLLEVLDRGPGVPESEREKIFEAFYRIGREETRTTTGTGLGLHLVRLHAETCGAKASVEAREGGGSNFRIAFRPAE
jgi:signal transduction histidine kinase